MDVNQIRYFLALADTLNFTRAAEQCFVSQPALTQAVKRLEEELGGSLIHREGRDTRLTELGRLLRGHFEKIEQTRQTVKETAQAYVDGSVQELNVGLMCTIGPRLVGRFLDDFQSRYPHILLLLHDVPHCDIPELLRSGTIDGAFGSSHNHQHNDALQSIRLFDESMVVAFPGQHAFSKRDAVPMIDIAREKYVDRLNCEFRDDFFAFCKKQSIEPKVIFRSQREDWILDFIREGIGVTVLPEYSLLQPALDHRPISEPSLSREVDFFVAHRDSHSENLSMLIEMARDYRWLDVLSKG
mgnify:CR=1 FL=1